MSLELIISWCEENADLARRLGQDSPQPYSPRAAYMLGLENAYRTFAAVLQAEIETSRPHVDPVHTNARFDA